MLTDLHLCSLRVSNVTVRSTTLNLSQVKINLVIMRIKNFGFVLNAKNVTSSFSIIVKHQLYQRMTDYKQPILCRLTNN